MVKQDGVGPIDKKKTLFLLAPPLYKRKKKEKEKNKKKKMTHDTWPAGIHNFIVVGECIFPPIIYPWKRVKH